MQQDKDIALPDNTAVRTALWRGLHVQADAEPHIIEDEVGLKLVAPPENWQERPDMKFTGRLRAAIVARARFIEDLVVEQSKAGVAQYVILGSGLDTFAQRRPGIASDIKIYEIDQPDTLAWKAQRLVELGFGLPDHLRFVAVDFETSSWWEQLLNAGFDTAKPAVAACTGVSLYLTKQAISDTLRRFAALSPGSTLAMTFYLPIGLLDEEDKPMQQIAEKGAREAGTPFVSFFEPAEVITMANKAGFLKAKVISGMEIKDLYFPGRTDGLMPASGEFFLLATT